MEEKYTEIADKIDQMNDVEQTFILWLLLGKHEELLNKELDKDQKEVAIGKVPEAYEVAYSFYRAELLRLLPKLRDDLAGRLW